MSDHTVLVIEDEPDLAELYAAWLEESCAVETATTGEEGLAKFDENVDTVFLDRRLPGLSGDTVLERIRSRSEQCRVVMVTAVEPDVDIVEMRFDEYLVKPITKDRLTATVERLRRRDAYTDSLDEYVTLVRKKSTLDAANPDSPLEQKAEYKNLEARIEELEMTIDSINERFDDADAAAVFREL